ncbi:hypothetical protein BDQ17DRAFT_1438198 [Cyathus striatus]|nr:hypothetical protein BDQ17DRAFT_1438198 [Cyathus striatus]
MATMIDKASSYDPDSTLKLVKTLYPIIITAHILAIVSTIFRLYHRFQTRKLWWDDFWAVISLVFDILLLSIYTSFPITRYVPDKTVTIVHWATMISLNFSLWAARISVGVTIIRLSNPSRMRQLSKGLMVLFGMLPAVFLIQKLFLCGKPTIESWRCVWPFWTGITDIIIGILADTWLTSMPAYMLWQMSLPRKHFRLLQSIFACGVLVTVAAVAHGVFVIEKRYVWMTSSAHFEIAISLIVCNLLVVVTYIYRVFWSTGETRVESTEETARVPTEEICTQIRTPSIPIAGLSASGHTRTFRAGAFGVSHSHSSQSSPSFLTLTTVEIDSSDFQSSFASYDTRSRSDQGTTQQSGSGRQTMSAASFSVASQPESRL